jgi:soluble lytic murein transglycosylase-like protein
MPYDEIINQWANKYSIDPNLIRAFIKTESNWNINAYRYEPKIKDASYGLMQVLLKSGQMITGNSKLTVAQLKDPTVNIMIGTKYIRDLIDKYGTQGMDAVYAAYNAGKPFKTKLGTYVNQQYVDKIKKWHLYYKGGLAIGSILILIGGIGLWWYFRKK